MSEIKPDFMMAWSLQCLGLVQQVRRMKRMARVARPEIDFGRGVKVWMGRFWQFIVGCSRSAKFGLDLTGW